MYAHFFGLKQAPFSIAPDPRYLFMSDRHREALAHLLYGLRAGGGFVLLTGEIGAGKTTVCNCFLEQIPENCNVAYIFNPKLTVIELLQSVCEEFGLPRQSPQAGFLTVKDCLDPLNTFLLKSHAAGQNNVLIIDEAQNLSEDVLEQLRLLTNLETSERKLLQIILIGQPGLRRMLARPELEQLAQRVIARFHLDAMTEAETALYIDHRLAVAGRLQGNPFERQALQRIHQHTGGIPRRINLLCDRAMLGAYGAGSATVDTRTVDKAASEVFDMAAPPALPPKPNGILKKLPVLMLGLAAGATAVGLANSWVKTSDKMERADTDTAQPWAKSPPSPTTVTAKAQPASVPALAPAKAITPIAPVGPVEKPAVAVSAPVTLASSSRSTDTVAESTVLHMSTAELKPNFTSPTRDVTVAWRALASSWKLDASAGDPCTVALQKHVQCFRIKSISLPLIQQLNRPGILTLLDDKQKPIYAILTSLNEQGASLQMGGTTQTVSINTLTQMWQGDFATYWRAPPGYAKAISAGSTGTEVDWLAAKLAQINGSPKPSAGQKLDAALAARVKGFQLAHGLKPDGVVGATTFMQINRVVGVDEPRLQTTIKR